MSNGATVGRGGIVLNVTPTQASPQRQVLRYEIYSDKIQFYELGSSGAPGSQYDVFSGIGGRSFTVTGGHLALVALPATPDAAFHTVTLSCTPEELTLGVSQSTPFADRGSTVFKDLNLQFTQSKSGAPLRVTGQVTLVLFDQAITLKPKLIENRGLVFEPEPLPTVLAIANLGNLTLTQLQVGASFNRWAELRALYTFDEGTVGKTLFDSSGSRDGTGNAQLPLDLEIRAGRVEPKSGGIAIAASNEGPDIRSKGRATKIIRACQKSKAIAIEAWIKPSASLRIPFNQRPVRIVTLSKNTIERNVTLGQDVNDPESTGDQKPFYLVRLRRTQDGETDANGTPELVSRQGVVKTDKLSYVVFTRDATGSAQFYINGEDISNPDAEVDFRGDFSGWEDADDVRLALANELTRDRAWAGEIHRVAIYSRALSREEVLHSYYPLIQITATLTPTNVPAPLNIAFPVSINLGNGQLTLSQTGLKVVEADLLFNEVNLVWSKTATDSRLLSGRVKATLWGNALEFAVSLTANQLLLALPAGTGEKHLSLKGLGAIALSKLDLSSDRTVPDPVWKFETDKTAGKGVTFETSGQPKLTVIPPPLKGPFPVELFLDAGDLWFSISPAPPPKPVVGPLTFDRADLRFRFVAEQDGWEPQSRWAEDKDIRIPLFGQSLSLTPSFAGGVFTLSWPVAPISLPPIPSDAFGKLQLTQFSLQAGTGSVVWQLTMGGDVPLRLADRNELAGTLTLDATGQILSNPANPSQPTRLEGKSGLKSLTEAIFAGDLQAASDRFFLNGTFTLFPNWSLLQVNQDVRIELAPDGRLQPSSTTPAQVGFPDFALLNPSLAIADGKLTLNGTWLNEPVSLTAIQRDRQSIWQQKDLIFDLPFDLPLSSVLGLLHEPHTAVHLVESMRGRGVQARLRLELSAAGFLSQVASLLQWQDGTHRSELPVPEFTLVAPPSTRHGLLGPVLQQVKANAPQIFASSFNHAADYFVPKDAPQIYLGDGSGLPAGAIATQLPRVFTLASQSAADPSAVFQLEQSAAECRLTINAANKTPTDLETAYKAFLAKLSELEARDKALLPGAVPLIKRRIAERLPMPLDRVLYYYYGFVVEPTRGGQYLDLQAGMRLRVDYQNYQDVPPTDRTAVSGFVGSGTSYYDLTTYLHPQKVGDPLYLLGFDPFVSRMQTDVQIDASRPGIPGIVDLLKPGFRQPYYRLFYPSNFFVAAGRPERAVTIAGAANLAELESASTDFLERSGTISNSDQRVSFFFRGRVVVIPEITVFVQDQPVYVPVGTTLRQLIERYAGIPASNLWQPDSPASLKPDLRSFQGCFRPRRLVHEGANSVPLYKFINVAEYRRYDNGMDIFDMPVVKGDRVYF